MVLSVVSSERLHNRLSRFIYLAFIEPLLWKPKRTVRSLVVELGKSRVLEVGCGTCVQAALIAEKGIDVTGVDISGQLFPPFPSARVPPTLTFFRADGRDLPFPGGQFDLALISLALHEMDPAGRLPVLREMLRVLREGGVLLIMDFHFEPSRDRSLTALIIRMIETMAGKEHHANFRNFLDSGGVPRLLQSFDSLEWKLHPILNRLGGVFEVRRSSQANRP
jgi:ubiquinone/menaquinone biosynthesis C-methylase UbiE